MRQPLHVVKAWPASEVRTIERYLSVMPAPEERIERLLALVATMTHNTGYPKATPKRVADYLPDPAAFEEPADGGDGRYSAIDMSFLRNL